MMAPFSPSPVARFRFCSPRPPWSPLGFLGALGRPAAARAALGDPGRPWQGAPAGGARPGGCLRPLSELDPLTATDVPDVPRPFSLVLVAFVGLHLVAAFMRVSVSV